MALKTIKQCLDIIFKSIEIRKKWDYGRGMSVTKFNAAYKRSEKHMFYIDKHYPDRTDVLLELLNHEDPHVVLHCAPMMLRFKNLSIEQKWKALETIKLVLQTSNASDIDRTGFKFAIPLWEKDLMEEQKRCSRTISEDGTNISGDSDPF